jgi:transposase
MAEALLLDEDTVRSYRQAYQQGGTDLLLTVRYQGSEPKLNPDQIRELDQHLSTTIYLRVQDIVAYVEKTFGVVYTVAGMTDFLKRLDYVYKKPTLTPGQHPDVEIQQAFIKNYQKLKESKGKDDPIYFMDGVHPRHALTHGFCYRSPVVASVKCYQELEAYDGQESHLADEKGIDLALAPALTEGFTTQEDGICAWAVQCTAPSRSACGGPAATSLRSGPFSHGRRSERDSAAPVTNQSIKK